MMQVKIKKHASRVQEAIDLCKLMVRNHHYEAAKKQLLEKYHFEVFDVSQMMDVRQEIADAFKERFLNDEAILSHYFKCRSGNIYLSDLFMELPYLQTEKRKCRYVEDAELNRSYEFMKAFLAMELMDETYPQEVYNFEDLSLLIEKLDIDREDKWMIQTTYLHLAEEMKGFVNFINQVVDWLSSYEDVLCQEEAAFYEYWSAVSEKKNLVDHLARKLNMVISKKASTLWLMPAFFNCQGIHSKNQKDSVSIYMGMIFDEFFSFDLKYETPALLCSQLKLLSDPSKFEILCTIKDHPYYGSELAKKFNLSTPTISHHMRALENAGFIKIEKKDNKSFYSLDEERLELFISQVKHMLLEKE